MLTGVRSVGIYVRDQDRAKDFWTDTVGFELVQDTPMGGEGAARWVEVAPPERNVILVLYTPPGEEARVGTFSNVLFECDDIHRTFEEMSARGVEFPDPPREEFWGWWAMFADPDGNTYGLGPKGQ